MTDHNDDKNQTEKRVCIAEITGTHGVRGLVKLRCFAEDHTLLTAGHKISDKDGLRFFTFTKLSPHKHGYLAAVEGITDCDQAKALAKTKLFIERSALPSAEHGEFYYVDLIGLIARLENGQDIGKISAVQNFGAGDLLEIKPETGQTYFIPFTLDAVPEVNITEGYVTIIPPNEVSERSQTPEQPL